MALPVLKLLWGPRPQTCTAMSLPPARGAQRLLRSASPQSVSTWSPKLRQPVVHLSLQVPAVPEASQVPLASCVLTLRTPETAGDVTASSASGGRDCLDHQILS